MPQVVANDVEMRRILDLPRRPQEWDEAKTEKARTLMTNWLKTPNGTWRLNAIQARMLVEAADYGVLCGPNVQAGGGKTLASMLLPTVMKAKRALLLVPAALREKTFDDYNVLKEQFKINLMLRPEEKAPPGVDVIRVMAYETISSVNYATWIDEYAPDLIIADEAHCLKQKKSGRSRRVFRYIGASRRRGHPVAFVPLTGTGWSRSISEIAHLMEASLGDQSPLPRLYTSLESWCMAVDQGIREDQRYGPGALLQLCSAEQTTQGLDGLRNAIRDRVLETPSVISTKAITCGIPLILQRRHIEVPPTIRSSMEALRKSYVLPTGAQVEKGVTFWNHAREIANGFAYYWDPPPPQPWLEARNAWAAFVRNVIDHPPKKMTFDTPLQVWNAVEHGTFGDVTEFTAWKNIRDTFKARTIPHWISDYMLRDAEQWAIENKGIVWVMHSTAYTSEEITVSEDDIGAQFKLIPYFGAGDERIKTYKGPCAASVRAHGTGKNLQQFNEALIMGFPSSGKTVEQLLARLHREGQKADLVKFNFYAHSKENLDALEKALGDAAFVKATSGSDQRILNAKILDNDGRSFSIKSFREQQDPRDSLWG